METGLSVGSSSLPVLSKKSGAQVKKATSGQKMTKLRGKLKLRTLKTLRESARRSRRRKQAHLTELEMQVSQVRVENSSLLKHLADISQKYNEAAVDNRVLKADVETLRANVKMEEGTVKRVTGLNPLFQAISEMSTIGIPSFTGCPSDTSADAAVPVQDDPKQHYYHHTASNNHLIAQDRLIQNGSKDIPTAESAAASVEVNKIGRSVSI